MVVSLFLVGEKSFPLLNFNFFFGCAGSSLLHGTFSGCGDQALFVVVPGLLTGWLLSLWSMALGPGASLAVARGF